MSWTRFEDKDGTEFELIEGVFNEYDLKYQRNIMLLSKILKKQLMINFQY